LFTDTGVKNYLADLVMQTVVKPAGGCGFNPHRPVDCRETLIMRPLKSCEMMEVWLLTGTKLFHVEKKVSRVLTNAATNSCLRSAAIPLN
jgi:hypothetical protein